MKPLRKVVSLSLFGENTRYLAYVPAFVRAHLTLFPIYEGWDLRVHVDPFCARDRLLHALHDRGLLRLVEVPPAPLTRAMLYRLGPIWTGDADYVFPRDVDALPTPRDRACSDRFIESGCDVHMVHDSQSHDGIMGGMGGYKADSFRELTKLKSLDDLIAFGDKTDEEWAQHGTDQIVLNRLILGWGRDNVTVPRLAIFEHRYAGWAAGRTGVGERKPNPRATVSEPVPDEGTLWRREQWETLSIADALCSHIGAAGFDVDRAIAFYNKHGGIETMNAVREAEQEAGR